MINIDINSLDFAKSDGLIPAIVQDAQTKKVLMLAYMNEASLSHTIETGLATFYSRSRNSLWTKGETSGNYLNVLDIRPDCDKDTLLVMVNPVGPACHTGNDTCFNEINSPDLLFLEYLQNLISERKRDMPEGSYTTKLFEKGVARIAQKVGEEAVETVISAMQDNDEDFLNEGSDLIYHLLVLLTEKGYGIADLAKVLKNRH